MTRNSRQWGITLFPPASGLQMNWGISKITVPLSFQILSQGHGNKVIKERKQKKSL